LFPLSGKEVGKEYSMGPVGKCYAQSLESDVISERCFLYNTGDWVESETQQSPVSYTIIRTLWNLVLHCLIVNNGHCNPKQEFSFPIQKALFAHRNWLLNIPVLGFKNESQVHTQEIK
jgi:hypothetical protein